MVFAFWFDQVIGNDEDTIVRKKITLLELSSFGFFHNITVLESLNCLNRQITARC